MLFPPVFQLHFHCARHVQQSTTSTCHTLTLMQAFHHPPTSSLLTSSHTSHTPHPTHTTRTQAHQFLHDLGDLGLSALNALFGTLQRHTVRARPLLWETDNHTTIFFRYLTNHLSTDRHVVTYVHTDVRITHTHTQHNTHTVSYRHERIIARRQQPSTLHLACVIQSREDQYCKLGTK